MVADVSGLETPVLLLAMPQVLDPFFHRSVVLLVNHSDEGSLGFIVNRPTEIRVAEILQGMEIAWQGKGDPLAFFGGPVRPHLGTILFDGPAPSAEVDLEPDEAVERSSEVVPGVHISQHIDDLEELAAGAAERFRLFLGYAGWGEGQLVEEILRNDWLTAPVQEEILFAKEAADAWTEALLSVGVDPSSLPSWTPDSGNGSAAN